MRLVVFVVALVVAPTITGAQSHRFVELTRTMDGHVLDYPVDGVWRGKARVVRERRVALMNSGRFAALNATGALAPALAGTLRFPSLLLSFSDNDTTTLPRTAAYDSLYYGTTPLSGRTYSLRTFYQELSNGLLNLEGAAAPWSEYDSTSSWLFTACAGGQATDCATGRQRMRTVFVDALTKMDATTDFGMFDNDGPDGVPNSGDDDGVADVVQFVQPALGAECGGPGIGAHKWFLSSLGGAYTTADARTGGGFITVNAYHIVSGMGGAGTNANYHGCGAPTEISGVGTSAHELGHGLGLPDLYDTSGPTEGLGEWGLMGSGNYTTANSPSHMEAWSRADLGWVSVVPLTTAGSYLIPPVISADTVFLIRPSTANPRGEYFLLESRQPVGSDTGTVLRGGNTGPKVGGLLIWHIDSTKIAQSRFSNTVNSGSIQGIALIQADGLNQLRASAGGNRGDAGDPWPGTANRTTFGATSNPAARLNTGNQLAGVTIDSIRQVVPGGNMAFRLGFGTPITVVVVGAGTVTGVGLTIPGTTLVSDTVVLTAIPDTGNVFNGWTGDTSTVQPTITLAPYRGWSVVATHVPVLAPASVAPVTTVLGGAVQVAFAASGGVGTFVWSLQAGTLPPGMTLNPAGFLTGVAEASGAYEFTLSVRSGAQSAPVPVSVSVTVPQLAVGEVVGAMLGGAALSTESVTYMDFIGNRNGGLDLGDFLAWVQTTGATPSASEMAAVVARGGDR